MIRHKFAIILVILGLTVFFFRDPLFFDVKTVATVEKADYDKKTGAILYHVRYMDDKKDVYRTTLKGYINPEYVRGEKPSTSSYLAIVYNKNVPSRARRNSEVPWKYLLMFVGFVALIAVGRWGLYSQISDHKK